MNKGVAKLTQLHVVTSEVQRLICTGSLRMRTTACCRKRYLVRWLSVVACWLNGQGLGLGLGPGKVYFFSPLVYKCGEHLCLRWLGIQSP